MGMSVFPPASGLAFRCAGNNLTDEPSRNKSRNQEFVAKVNSIQVQKFLGGMYYPASKDEIARHAEQNGANENVLNALLRIPDRQYDAPNAVSHEISEAW
jgi:hypothetical protein